jgi:hypothetical protein
LRERLTDARLVHQQVDQRHVFDVPRPRPDPRDPGRQVGLDAALHRRVPPGRPFGGDGGQFTQRLAQVRLDPVDRGRLGARLSSAGHLENVAQGACETLCNVGVEGRAVGGAGLVRLRLTGGVCEPSSHAVTLARGDDLQDPHRSAHLTRERGAKGVDASHHKRCQRVRPGTALRGASGFCVLTTN